MSFFGRPQTVRRRGAGEYVNGFWVENTEFEAIPVRGSIQPMNGEDMQSLPEGRRTKAGYKLYTKTELRTASEGVNPDEVFLFGEWYEVFHVEPWQNGILPHYKCFLQKLNDPPVEPSEEEEEGP